MEPPSNIDDILIIIKQNKYRITHRNDIGQLIIERNEWSVGLLTLNLTKWFRTDDTSVTSNVIPK